jgi:transcriptional regulator with XRE-family HTH domain
LRALGPDLRSLREARKLSQKELGALAGIEQPHISAIEQGKRLPGLRTLLMLCEALGAPPPLPGARVSPHECRTDA